MCCIERSKLYNRDIYVGKQTHARLNHYELWCLNLAYSCNHDIRPQISLQVVRSLTMASCQLDDPSCASTWTVTNPFSPVVLLSRSPQLWSFLECVLFDISWWVLSVVDCCNKHMLMVFDKLSHHFCCSYYHHCAPLVLYRSLSRCIENEGRLLGARMESLYFKIVINLVWLVPLKIDQTSLQHCCVANCWGNYWVFRRRFVLHCLSTRLIVTRQLQWCHCHCYWRSGRLSFAMVHLFGVGDVVWHTKSEWII
jgi:hypothetical protein